MLFFSDPHFKWRISGPARGTGERDNYRNQYKSCFYDHFLIFTKAISILERIEFVVSGSYVSGESIRTDHPSTLSGKGELSNVSKNERISVMLPAMTLRLTVIKP